MVGSVLRCTMYWIRPLAKTLHVDFPTYLVSNRLVVVVVLVSYSNIQCMLLVVVSLSTQCLV